MASRHVGDIELFHDDDNNFHVIKDGVTHEVRNYNIDEPLRRISHDDLIRFIGNYSIAYVEFSTEQLANLDFHPVSDEEREMITDALNHSGYIYVSCNSDGEYLLRAHRRVRGGSILPMAGLASGLITLLGIPAIVALLTPTVALPTVVAAPVPMTAVIITAVRDAAAIAQVVNVAREADEVLRPTAPIVRVEEAEEAEEEVEEEV